MQFKASVIVTTYNWPAALELVVRAFAEQSVHSFELLIADDGSGETTAVCVQALQKKYAIPIRHVWQPDQGFRAAQIRNKAVAAARGEYLIFIDGDSIPRSHFIQHHLRLAEKGYFVPGARVFLRQAFTQQVLLERIPLHTWSLWQLCCAYRKHHLKWLRHLFPWYFNIGRKFFKHEWAEAQTCNLGVWREDFFSVNGFDESYQGWGYEDSDLVVRLLHAGVQRKSGKFGIPILHLWHQQHDQTRRDENYQRFLSVLEGNKILADKGVSQYLA